MVGFEAIPVRPLAYALLRANIHAVAGVVPRKYRWTYLETLQPVQAKICLRSLDMLHDMACVASKVLTSSVALQTNLAGMLELLEQLRDCERIRTDQRRERFPREP